MKTVIHCFDCSSDGVWNMEQVHMDIHEGLCKTTMALS